MAYPTVSEVRAEGVPTSISDARILEILNLQIERVETLTENYFIAKSATIEMDGSGTDTLFLPIPIISVTSVYLNESADALDTTAYKVWAGQEYYHANRNNPKIVLLTNRYTGNSIFAPGGLSSGVFYEGYTQTIVGSFGTLENGATPLQINWVIKRLTTSHLANLYGWNPSVNWPNIEEKVDRHRVRRADMSAATGDGDYWTGDPEMDAILHKYQAPKGIAVCG